MKRLTKLRKFQLDWLRKRERKFISIDAEKTFHNIQHPSMIRKKKFNKLSSRTTVCAWEAGQYLTHFKKRKKRLSPNAKGRPCLEVGFNDQPLKTIL